jgi:hypothetical protein
MTSAPSGPKYVPKHGRAAGQSVLRMRGLPRLFWRWMLHSQRIIAGIMRMFGISGYCRCNDQSRIDALARVSIGGITQQDVGPQRDGTRKAWPRQAARQFRGRGTVASHKTCIKQSLVLLFHRARKPFRRDSATVAIVEWTTPQRIDTIPSMRKEEFERRAAEMKARMLA